MTTSELEPIIETLVGIYRFLERDPIVQVARNELLRPLSPTDQAAVFCEAALRFAQIEKK
jgi:hypothetical protein